MGHVDTGKTSLLDKIRSTSVQKGEAGGITQQIGATFFPADAIRKKTEVLNEYLNKNLEVKVPGMLIIDTPGHESFSNLRSRGSSLCDVAILVIDVMHGLEAQTIESINMLRERKTPFVVALNKVDRMYTWQATEFNNIQASLKQQNQGAQDEFDTRMKSVVAELAVQGLNACLYWDNPDPRKWVSLVPTSAHTGEGIPDLLMLIVQMTQKMMDDKLGYVSTLQCTVLEVKVVDGLGTTIDVILVNGVLREGDTIVLCGLNGPIVTTIRALLTPPPLRELRIKSEYITHKEVQAAMGLKISAANMENVLAGSSLMVLGPRDDLEEIKDEVMSDLQSMMSKIDMTGNGVYVQASTLGSLEALMSFLRKMKIPVSGIGIGPVHKKDVMKASVQLEKKPEYAVLLAFDVKVDPDAKATADKLGLTIYTADIIYHLFDKCTKHMEDIKQKRRLESAGVAVFPCVLDIFGDHIYNQKNPIIMGVKVVEGILRIGTPVCIPSKDFLLLGKVASIEQDHKEKQEAKKGDEVCINIDQSSLQHPPMYKRHFDANDQVVSMITRQSIDLLKENFKEDMTDADWKLIIRLKKLFDIM
jgi:translation initiation factor 5B